MFLQRRKLDAVYYYMRSLAASNPILTAKESLMSLFEETKRKVSLGAELWDGAAVCAGSSVLESCGRIQRGGLWGFWMWSHYSPTSNKFHVESQMRDTVFRITVSFLPLLRLLLGLFGQQISCYWFKNCKTAKLREGCRLLWFATWPWHVV